MTDSSERDKRLFEEGETDSDTSFRIIQQSASYYDNLMDISDSTYVTRLEILYVPIEPLAFSPVDFEDSTLLKDLFSSNQSTQIFRATPKGFIDFIDIKQYEKSFADILLQLINEEIFEFGMENAADSFVQENLRDNAMFTKEWLNSIFLEYFSDIEITTGLLRIIAHLNYTEIAPTGPTMAVAALSHENAEVRECGIRAFENWGDTDSLGYLKHIKCKEKWLQNYLEQVISDLEEFYVFSGEKN